mgnify:CR=1 FL=1
MNSKFFFGMVILITNATSCTKQEPQPEQVIKCKIVNVTENVNGQTLTGTTEYDDKGRKILVHSSNGQKQYYFYDEVAGTIRHFIVDVNSDTISKSFVGYLNAAGYLDHDSANTLKYEYDNANHLIKTIGVIDNGNYTQYTWQNDNCVSEVRYQSQVGIIREQIWTYDLNISNSINYNYSGQGVASKNAPTSAFLITYQYNPQKYIWQTNERAYNYVTYADGKISNLSLSTKIVSKDIDNNDVINNFYSSVMYNYDKCNL